MSPHLTGLNWLNDDKHSPCQLSRVTGVKVFFLHATRPSSLDESRRSRWRPSGLAAKKEKKDFFLFGEPTDGRTDGLTNGEPGEVKCASDREAS